MYLVVISDTDRMYLVVISDTELGCTKLSYRIQRQDVLSCHIGYRVRMYLVVISDTELGCTKLSYRIQS